MSERTNGTIRGDSITSRPVRVAVRIGLAALLVVTVVAGAGVVVADNHEDNERAPCPYENGNQGVENAHNTGLEKSSPGIGTAATQICD